MNELKINIIGPVSSGKSTIADIISNALKDHGFKVTLRDLDSDKVSFKEERIQALVEKETNISIEVFQSSKNAFKYV